MKISSLLLTPPHMRKFPHFFKTFPKCLSTIQGENMSVKTLNPNNLMAVIATLTMNLPLTQKADLLFEIIGHWGIECLCSIVFCVV